MTKIHYTVHTRKMRNVEHEESVTYSLEHHLKEERKRYRTEMQRKREWLFRFDRMNLKLDKWERVRVMKDCLAVHLIRANRESGGAILQELQNKENKSYGELLQMHLIQRESAWTEKELGYES